MSPPPAHGHGHSHGGFISHHTFNHQTAAPHHVNHPIVSAHQSLPSHHHTTPPTFTAARQTINGVQFQPINHNHPHSPPHPHQHTQPIITNANNGNFIEVSGNDVYISAHQQQEQQAFFSQIPSQHVLVTAYPNMNNNAPGVIDPCPGDANSGVWLGFLLGVFLSPFIAIPVALTFSNKPRRFERQLRGAAIASILWSLPFWAVFAWWVIAPPQNCYSLSTYNYSTNKDYYSVYCYLSTSYFVVWALSAFLPLGILFSFTGIILLVISSSVRRNARRTNKKVLEILKSGGTQKEHRESKRDGASWSQYLAGLFVTIFLTPLAGTVFSMIGWSDKPGRSVSRFKGSSHGCFLYSILFSIALYLNVNSSGWLIFNVLLCLFFLWSIVLGTTWWTIMINAKYSDRMIAHVHGDYEIWKDANDTGYGDWIGSFMVTLVCTPFSSCFFCFASSSRPRTTMARNFGCAAGSAVYAICLWIAMVLLDYFVGDYQFSSSSYQYYINYGQLWQLSMGVPAVIFTVWAIMHIAIGFSLMVSIARARTIAAAAALGAPQEYPPPTGRKRGYLVGMMLELFWTPVFAIPFALAFGKSDPKFSSSAMYGAAFMTMLEAFGVCGILGWQIASRKNGGFSGFSDSHQIQNSSYNYFGFFIEPVVLVLILLSVAMIVCFSFFWVLAWIYGKQIKYSQRLISMASSSSKMMIKQQQPQVQYMQQMIQPVVITSPPVQLQQQLATPSTMDFVSTPIITNQSSTAPLLQPMLSNSNNNNNNNYSPQSIATFDKQPLPLNDYTQQNQIRPTGTFRPVQHQQSSNMGVDAATDYHVGGSGSGGSTSGKGKANGVSIGDGNDALPPAYVPGENGASFAARGEKKDMFLHPASSFNAGGESSSSSNGGGSASQQPSAPHDEEEEEEVYYHPPEAGSLSYSSNHAQQNVEEASAPFLTIDRSYTPAPPPPGPHPFQVRSFSQVSVPSPPFEPSASFSSSSLPPVPPPPPAPFTPPPPPALPFSDISSPFTDVESPFTDVLTPAPPPPPQQNQYSVRVDNATEFWNINFGAGTVVTGEDLKMALEIRRIGSSAALPWNDNDYVDLDNFLIIVNDVKNPIFYLFY